MTLSTLLSFTAVSIAKAYQDPLGSPQPDTGATTHSYFRAKGDAGVMEPRHASHVGDTLLHISSRQRTDRVETNSARRLKPEVEAVSRLDKSPRRI